MRNEYARSWPVLDYKKQSVIVPGTKKPGQTGHYRNAAFGFLDLDTPGTFKTVVEIFDNGLRLGGNAPFLGSRPIVSRNPLKYADHYVWETYGEVDSRRRNLGSALHALFQKGELGGGEMDTVGIWSQNRPEWQIIDLSLHAYNKVGVSLYDTLGKDSVEYIISHAYITIIFATSDHIPVLLKIASKVPMVKMIVSIDDLSPDTKNLLTTWGEAQNVQVKELRELEAIGMANPIDPIPATIDQVASICYTSGTTSVPKGVILRHKHLAVSVQSNVWGLDFPEDAILLSYLPLAHIYERIAELCVIGLAGRIGYFTGDPLRLLEDAQVLKPNFFPSVPRILNKIYQSAMVAGNVPGLKGSIFNKAVKVKLDQLRATGVNTHPLWDRLVFRKIQAVLGGKLKLLFTGSAPISPEVMDFLKIAFACDCIEECNHRYGMTENCATCTRTWPYDSSSSGTVGPPQAANEIKLVDVPAMGYGSEDKPNPRGEICARGVHIFEQYHKDQKNTRETIDDEGWIHTGDVGEFDECGRLKIIDRVKNIMKLAQGEYVALEKIENLYSSCNAVGQIYVHGDSLQSFLLAVVVPDPVQLAGIASSVLKTKVVPADIAALQKACWDERVNQRILALLTKEAKRHGLKGFETIKRVHLTMQPFTVENGTLTPTFKIRRKEAHNKYKAELDALYALGEPSPTKL